MKQQSQLATALIDEDLRVNPCEGSRYLDTVWQSLAAILWIFSS
jgi:hypothetical protein